MRSRRRARAHAMGVCAGVRARTGDNGGRAQDKWTRTMQAKFSGRAGSQVAAAAPAADAPAADARDAGVQVAALPAGTSHSAITSPHNAHVAISPDRDASGEWAGKQAVVGL
jgi:hypothetical protein